MSKYDATCLRPRAASGFTLVELMVVIAVVGILTIVAMPAMTELINNGRATSQAEELVTSLQLARAEAVRRNARVTICPGANGACNGTANWAQLTAFGRDNTAAVPVDDVIRDTAATGNVVIAGPTAGIVFTPSGRISATQRVEVTKYDKKRCLTVSISGVVTVDKAACP